MFFMGLSATNMADTAQQTIVSASDVNILDLKNAIVDKVYCSTNEDLDIDSYDNLSWDFDCCLYAEFNGDLHGGSVGFTEEVVESIRLKKKAPGDMKFKTIYEKPVHTNDDLNIDIADYYEPVGNIEYAYVPIISGAESNYIISSIQSEFDYAFILDKETSYPLILDRSLTFTDKFTTGLVEPIGRKKPILVRNGICNYGTFDVSAKFIELKTDCNFDTENSWSYRNKVREFLKNGNVKLLKDIEGNIYMVSLNGDISQSEDNFVRDGNVLLNAVDTSFSLVEVGDAKDVGDLYDNGFIDTDLDR